jgi:hypothetical protein
MSRARQCGLFFALFFAYLALGSREVPWNDGKRIHQVAESIVYRRSVEVSVPTPLLRDGKYYALNPMLPSAIHIPGVVLHKGVSKAWPQTGWVMKALGSHVGPAALAALLCLMFALLCRDLGISALATNLSVLVVAFGTMVAVYARSPWSEMCQAAVFMGFFLWLLRLVRNPTPAAAVWVGFWAGLLINTKAIYVLGFPGAGLLAGWIIYRQHGRGRLLRCLGLAALGALPGLVLMLAYNYARTGSLTNIGYPLQHQTQREFVESPIYGLMGLFLSPGKSVFLYNPPVILGLCALPRVLRRHDRTWFWALLLTAVPVILFYSKFLFWSGDWCWGPRYLLFVIPLLWLPAAFLLDELLAVRRRLALGLTGVMLAAGLVVQFLGAILYWDHYIRLAQDVQRQWLGNPKRGGAPSLDRGIACDPCFEDFYGFNWLPPLSPLSGHLWLWKHVSRGDTWQQAELDAPWHRYTTLKFNFAGSYGRARADWWLLDWQGRLAPAGRVLMAIMVLGTVGAALLWWWPWLQRRRPRRLARAPALQQSSELGVDPGAGGSI